MFVGGCSPYSHRKGNIHQRTWIGKCEYLKVQTVCYQNICYSIIAGDHILNHLSIPVACFTHPNISMVGLTEVSQGLNCYSFLGLPCSCIPSSPILKKNHQLVFCLFVNVTNLLHPFTALDICSLVLGGWKGCSLYNFLN